MSKPTPPDLPNYVLDPLEKQSAERLKTIADYATRLAAHKEEQRQAEFEEKKRKRSVDNSEIEELEERDVSTDPNDYDDVPSGAYITIKTPKDGYKYYYWQWRDGDSWKNEYIAPVNPKRDS